MSVYFSHSDVKQKKSAYTVVDVPGGWGVACCVEGERGYHPVDEYGPYQNEETAKIVVDRLNKRLELGPVGVRRIVGSTMPRVTGRTLIGYRVRTVFLPVKKYVVRFPRLLKQITDKPDPIGHPEALRLLADWLECGYNGHVVSVWRKNT